MIITKTPFRMSFFGGGTDMPEFFNKHTGSVISTTFDKYCYVVVRHLPRFFNYTSELVYSKTERITGLEEIEHPLIRNCMKFLNMHELRLSYEGDLPARTGLGTSSSFAVGMLSAFYSLKGEYADKRKLAEDAIHVERDLCAEAGGWQDQIAAAYGGLNRIDFSNNHFEVSPIIISPSRKKLLNDNLALFFTGFTRFSAEIQKSTKASIEDKTAQLEKMLELVNRAEKILEDKTSSIDDFGYLLGESWELKRQTGSGISNDLIDSLYRRGIQAGALGGKLLGAGGGGFLLFYVTPEKREQLIESMKDLQYIPFQFEDYGTQIAYYSPEQFDKDTAIEK